MKVLDQFIRLFSRFRYPVSLPENIAEPLGIELSNFITFEEFLQILSDPNFHPSRLKKFMPREEAEKAFEGAVKIDRFQHQTLYSYYFTEGWLEFVLIFDDDSRLRRLYLQHKYIPQEEGLEIHLESI